MEGERHGDMSPASLLCGDSGRIFSSDTDSSTVRRILRRSLPQKGSTLGTSSPSALGLVLCSGDDGMGGTWSCGSLPLLWGGEVEEDGGGETALRVGV